MERKSSQRTIPNSIISVTQTMDTYFELILVLSTLIRCHFFIRKRIMYTFLVRFIPLYTRPPHYNKICYCLLFLRFQRHLIFYSTPLKDYITKKKKMPSDIYESIFERRQYFARLCVLYLRIFFFGWSFFSFSFYFI